MFVSLLALLGMLHATDLEQNLVERLSRARSGAEARAMLADFRDLRVARKACRIELRSRSIPTSCFEALRLERAWGVGQERAEHVRRRLDDHCRALSTLELGTVRSEGLSGPCLTAARRARELRTYRDETWSGS